MLGYDSYTASNSIGPRHTENQDSYLVDPENLIFAVADGVGGYEGGKEASELAIGTLRENSKDLFDENSVRDCLTDIHLQVKDRARSLRFQDMGTTIAVTKILPKEKRIITGNVGDSPILLLPRGGSTFRKLFTDDSFRSEDPRSMWAITQYLGVEEIPLEAHAGTFEYSEGDILLICSDGITDNLPNSSSETNLPDMIRRDRSARRLVEEAIKVDLKHDDMTAVLVFL